MKSATWWRPHANEIDQYGSRINYPQKGDLLAVEWMGEVRIGICLGQTHPDRVKVVQNINGWRYILYDVLIEEKIVQSWAQDTRLLWRKE